MTRRVLHNDNFMHPGPFIAKVTGHNSNGDLEVKLMHDVNPDNRDSITAKYMTPFYGRTNSTQEISSYGMWFVPPDIDTYVVVILIQGRLNNAYWIGCIEDPTKPPANFMIPSVSATENHNRTVANSERLPANENSTSLEQPRSVHPLYDTLKAQGLLKDDTRGITTSSITRNATNNGKPTIFGIRTPGPVDKTKKENSNIRTGGTELVFDDGNPAFLRKTLANQGPPVYIDSTAVQTEQSNRLHNELFRIRTRTGHQLLFHNSEDLIYIGNAKGTAWIELTSDGKVDIFASDSVSIHSNADFNFHAGRDVNIEATRNVNLKANNEIRINSVSNMKVVVNKDMRINVIGEKSEKVAKNLSFSSDLEVNVHAAKDCKITSLGTSHFNSVKKHLITAVSIGMNGSPASVASISPSVSELTTHSVSNIKSIMKRVTTKEPYKSHENLDPLLYKINNTDRETTTAVKDSTYAEKYSTNKDILK